MMNDFSFSLRSARLHTQRYFAHTAAAKIITAVLFIALIVAIGVTVYVGVHAGFTAMNNEVYGQQTLPLYTYEIFFLVMSYLMMLSAIASSFFAIARHEDEWIAATPRYKMLLSRSVRSVFFASLWPLLILGLPAILALRSVYGGGLMYLLTGLFGLILTAGVACVTAIAFVLLVAELLHAVHMLRMKRLVAIIVILVGLITWVVLRHVLAMNVVSLFVSGPIDATQGTVAGIVQAFYFFPTQFMALLMLNLQNGALLFAWKDVGVLAIMAGIVGFVIYLLSFAYLGVWQKLEEGSFEARTEVAVRNSSTFTFLRTAKTKGAAIFYKEVIMNIRNLRNATWLFFMLALWIIQTALNIFLRHNIAHYGSYGQNPTTIVQSLQLITATFFVSAFVLRFILPSFSSERRMAWILATAPISVRRIFATKFAFYGVLLLILGLGLGVINSLILGTALLGATGFLTLLGIMIACIITFGFLLGALFPNTESDDPETISTSLPGLSFTFISLLYGACGTWLYYLELTTSQFGGQGIIAFVIVSIIVIACMLAATLSKLKTFNPFAQD